MTATKRRVDDESTLGNAVSQPLRIWGLCRNIKPGLDSGPEPSCHARNRNRLGHLPPGSSWISFRLYSERIAYGGFACRLLWDGRGPTDPRIKIFHLSRLNENSPWNAVSQPVVCQPHDFSDRNFRISGRRYKFFFVFEELDASRRCREWPSCLDFFLNPFPTKGHLIGPEAAVHVGRYSGKFPTIIA